jgi:hypothetical protein
VLVAGTLGSAKVTLLACLAAELEPSLRLVVAEPGLESDSAAEGARV